MNRSHVYSLGGGLIFGAALTTGRPWLVAAAMAGMFLLGLVTGCLLLYATRIGKRVTDRIDRALPDRRDRYGFRWDAPISEDDAYLEGIERGMRSARRSAGHEDGRIIEADRLAGRPTP